MNVAATAMIRSCQNRITSTTVETTITMVRTISPMSSRISII